MEKSTGAKQLYEEKISYLLGQVERAENEIEQNISLINNCKTTFSLNQQTLLQKAEELKELQGCGEAFPYQVSFVVDGVKVLISL